MSYIEDLIDDTGVYDCVECGKCTTVCPVAALNPEFAPRLIVVKAIEGLSEETVDEKDLWSCLTCSICSNLCPYDVDYCELIRGMRVEAKSKGRSPACSQGGLLQTMARIMTDPNLTQNRLKWVTDDLDISEKGKVFYFTGCLPHFEIVFEDLDVKTTEIGRGVVQLLNSSGITPVVSNREVCCGHDLNWTGDEENFEKLMELNLKTIAESGAETVIFSCPECLRTFDIDYREIAGDLDFELKHISEFLLELLEEGKLVLDKSSDGDTKEQVTYHDPCRLGRHLGIYDPPREALEEAGLEVIEMAKSKEEASCCGVSAFANCESMSKKMQIGRMMEAKATGASSLVTTCPKCMIHLKCATSKEVPVEREKVDIPIEDLTVRIARKIRRK